MINYYKQAMLDVHDEILKLHDELEKEHHNLSANWLGLPRKRHHQIIGASRVLVELGNRISQKEIVI